MQQRFVTSTNGQVSGGHVQGTQLVAKLPCKDVILVNTGALARWYMQPSLLAIYSNLLLSNKLPLT